MPGIALALLASGMLAPQIQPTQTARQSQTGPSLVTRGPGCDPKTWGMSAACARMVRAHKLRANGWSGQHI